MKTLGRHSGLLVAGLAMAAAIGGIPIIGRERAKNESHQPDNRGRRAEKDAAAMNRGLK